MLFSQVDLEFLYFFWERECSMRMKIDIKREKEKQKAWEIMINHMVRHLFNIFYCKKIKPKIFLKTIIEKMLQKKRENT